jgi:hypothetical protein
MIYSCESKTWKRLTSAHCARRAFYTSAPRAEQIYERSVDSGPLLAYINIWASDEEKLHFKRLRGTNIHECSSGIKGLLMTLQMREATDWLAGYDFPVIIRKESRRPLLRLARAVLRIRITVHPDCLSYDMDGLLRTLRARVMLGILEERFRVYLFELQIGVKSFIKKTQLCLVLRVLRCWGVRGKCDSTYGEVLKMLVSACKRDTPSVVLNLSTVATIPGLTVDKRSSTQLQRYMDRMPRALANAPVHKQVCWHCKNVVESPLRKCSGCKRARYCSRICQKEGWGEHQRACQAVACFLNRQLIGGVMFDEVSVHETWGSFLPEHIERREKMMLDLVSETDITVCITSTLVSRPQTSVCMLQDKWS